MEPERLPEHRTTFLSRFTHSRWTLLAPLGLTILASFSGSVVRAFCLLGALIISTWIVYDTEFAKGPEMARHTRNKRIRRTVATSIVFAIVATCIFWGSNRIDTFAQNQGKSATIQANTQSSTAAFPSNPVLPSVQESKNGPAKQSPTKPKTKHVEKSTKEAEIQFPQGELGINAEPGANIHMRDSQVAGYQQGIHAGTTADVDMVHSQVTSDPRAPMPTPTPNIMPNNPYSPTSSISNITILGRRYDLTPALIQCPNKTKSTLTPEQQRGIVTEFENRWKADHKEDPAIRKSAIMWIEGQLEASNKDFCVRIPTTCPPDPDSVAIYVGPGGGNINGVTTKGFSQGVEVNGGTANINNSEVVSTGDCN
jgi:hypothetical protein